LRQPNVDRRYHHATMIRRVNPSSAACSLSVSVFALVIVLALAGCHRKKIPAPAPAPSPSTACASNQDCDDGWACLARRCADARKVGAFTHSEQAVTPEKVRLELEQRQDQHMRQIDKAAEMPCPQEN
jgi:hypothetical protein